MAFHFLVWTETLTAFLLSLPRKNSSVFLLFSLLDKHFGSHRSTLGTYGSIKSFSSETCPGLYLKDFTWISHQYPKKLLDIIHSHCNLIQITTSSLWSPYLVTAKLHSSYICEQTWKTKDDELEVYGLFLQTASMQADLSPTSKLPMRLLKSSSGN